MFLKSICLFVCVNLFSYTKCSIPVVKLCVSPTCQEPISMAKGKLTYQPKENEVLGFKPGQKITITSKSENKDDYWGAIIDGKAGYVPAEYVQEYKVFYGLESLKPVLVQRNKSISDFVSSNNEILSKNLTTKSSPPQLSQSVVGVPNNLEKPNPTQKPIDPGKSFQIVEGTTIYENDEIIPSTTADVNSAPQTATPVSGESGPKRTPVPSEVVDMNASYKGQEVKNLKDDVIEHAKKNDEEAVIESKDLNMKGDENDENEDEGEGEGEGEGESEDEDEEEDDEEEEDDDSVANDLSNDLARKNDKSKSVNAELPTNQKLEEMIASSTQSIHSDVVKDLPETRVYVLESSITSQSSQSIDGITPAKQQSVAKVTSPENLSNKIEMSTQEVSSSVNLLNEKKNSFSSSKANLNALSHQPVQSFDIVNATTQSDNFEYNNDNSAPPQQVKSDVSAGAPQSVAEIESDFFGAAAEKLQPKTFGESLSSQSETKINSETFNPVKSVAVDEDKFPSAEAQKMPDTVSRVATQQLLPETSAPTTATPFPQSEVKLKSKTSSTTSQEIPAETFNATPQSVSGAKNEFPNTAAQQMPDTVSRVATQQLLPETSAPTTATPFPQSEVKLKSKTSSTTSQEIPAGTFSATAQSVADVKNEISNAAAQQMPDTVSRVATQQLLPETSAPTTATPFPQSDVKLKSEIPGVILRQVPAGTFSATARSVADVKNEISNAGVQQMPDTGPLAISQSTSQIPDAVTPKKVLENPTETYANVPQSVISKTSTIFNQFSVSADTLPDVSKSMEKPVGVIQEKVEVTTETLPRSVVTEVAQSTMTDVTPELTQEKVKISPEASIFSEATTDSPKEDPSVIYDAIPEHFSEISSSPENKAEEPGLVSQIKAFFSSWFKSAPKDFSTEKELNFETDFQDALINEATLGTCQNPGSDIECKDYSSWSAWLPTAFGLDHILAQSNTLLYLVVTAVTVLLFTLGHNVIEKRGVTGPLIAKINKLEHELLVTSKECLLLKDEIQSAREKITLYENSANDELIVTLQAELEESKKVRTELESSIEVLQQELDAATEAGLDLNKMLTEVLTQKGGSDSLLKSVENLQAQLDSQQEVINEMTKKLGLKNQENEDLQSALNSANERSQNLEEEITDMKHNLNLHLREKEELTKELNSQINQLKTRIHQLAEKKGKEISKLQKESEELQKKLSETMSALTVKEEEVNALKESMKLLKTPGDVQMETVFDVSRIKAELAKEIKENHLLLEKLQKEEANNNALAEQVKDLDGKVKELKKSYEEAEMKKDEAAKKLEVLSTYFKEKETQLQKELGLQEALWAQKKGDEKAVYNMMKSLQEEVDSYKSQNETLKKEVLDQERALKSQMASYEQKAYENWVAARQAERKLEESKQEMAQLRNRLILVEKNSNSVEGKNNLRSQEELNGVEATSPILHETSSPLLFPPLPLDPNSSTLLPPGFMPPPMFIPPPIGGFMPPPPFLPGDRRPPPLGRMSSPPLNSRFSPSSPADYPFERMSSPPLSPPGRLANEDREHYRHRTPPFPPPLHPRTWDDNSEIPGFIPISSQRDSRRDHKGSNISSEHSSSESLDKSSRHSGRV